VSEVLSVAVQSDNYCLFYQSGNWFLCLTKSEWAAWSQAIFSILAIIGSAWISNNLFAKEKKHELDLRKREFLIKAISVASNLRQFSVDVKELLENSEKYNINLLNIQIFHDKFIEILNKSPLPADSFIEKSVYVDEHLARSLAIASEAVRQLINNSEVYIKNYKKDNYIIPTEKIPRIIEMLDYVNFNATLSNNKLQILLKSNGLSLAVNDEC